MSPFSLLLTALFLVAPALAISITSPGQSVNWTSTGPNALAWTRVSTDATTFSVVLVHDDRKILPVNNVVVATSIDAVSASTATISPTSGQLPLGSGFRVNFVNASDTNAIFAQSLAFTIVQGTAAASGSSSATSANPSATKTGDVSVHLPSFWGALTTALVVTLITA